MKVCAGVLIVLKNEKVLLCCTRNKSHGPPKGSIELNETRIQAAIREVKEEVGIDIDINLIANIDKPILINYVSKLNTTYKKVYLYIKHIECISEIGLIDEILPKNMLQIEEIRWAGFVDRHIANTILHKRYKKIINNILN